MNAGSAQPIGGGRFIKIGKGGKFVRGIRRARFRVASRVVILGYGLLPHKTSKGYTPAPFSVVTRVNGTPVRNLAHLVELLRDAKGEFLTVDLAGTSSPMVFRCDEILKATDDILADEGVRKQYSDDLESVWHRGK